MRNVTSAVGRAVASALLAVAACVFAFAGNGTVAMAASYEGVSIEDAGNVLGSSSSDTPVTPAQKIERDLYWAGGNSEFVDVDTAGDIVVAGMNIDVTNCSADGSIRVAGMNLTLTNLVAKNNFTVAGRTVELTNCQANGSVYAAAQEISFSGKAGGAKLTGQKVTFNGEVDGDVSIAASEVVIGPDAVVTGTMTVSSDTAPTVDKNAQIADLNHQVDHSSTDRAAAIAAIAATAAMVAKVVAVAGGIVLSLLIAWLLRGPVESAAKLTRRHAGRIIATGAIAMVAAPVAFVLMLTLVVTSPAALALLFLMLAIGFIAVPFAGVSIARLLLPNMNRFLSALIGGAVSGVALALPFAGPVVFVAGFIYTFGFVIQSAWRAAGASSDDSAGPDGADGLASPDGPDDPCAPVAPALAE